MTTNSDIDALRDQLRKGLDEFEEKFLLKIPEPLRSKLSSEIRMLRDIFIDSREPRFVMVGPSGAGKSSLINAIFGQKVALTGDVKPQTGRSKWYNYKGKNGELAILDTRGLGEGSKPTEETQHKSPKEEIKAAIVEQCPDALIFLCRATEVRAHIKADVKEFKEIKSFVLDKHSYDPPILGVITQVDLLAPPDVAEPPYNDPDKQKNITEATDFLSEILKQTFEDIIDVIPTSAYMRFSNGDIVHDRRWNRDVLFENLSEKIPKNAMLPWAKLGQLKSLQKKIARRVTRMAAGLAGAVGAQPIPFADMPIITGIQIGMVMSIGYISGREMNRRTAEEFLAAMGVNVVTGVGLRELARALLKLVPGPGNLISGFVAAAATLVIGEAAIAYFIEGLSYKKAKREAKRVYKKDKKKREDEIKS